MDSRQKNLFPVHAVLTRIRLSLSAEAVELEGKPNREVLDAFAALDYLVQRAELIMAITALDKYLAVRRC